MGDITFVVWVAAGRYGYDSDTERAIRGRIRVIN